MAVRGSVVLLLLIFTLPESVDADLITHFNLKIDGKFSATISADIEMGLVNLDEKGNPWPADELDIATGMDMNAVVPDPASTAFSLDDNGVQTPTRILTFEIVTTGYANTIFPTAMAESNLTYNTRLTSYSLDGTIFAKTRIPVDSFCTGSSELHSADLSGAPTLNDQSSLFKRLNLSGDRLAPDQLLWVDNCCLQRCPQQCQKHRYEPIRRTSW